MHLELLYEQSYQGRYELIVLRPCQSITLLTVGNYVHVNISSSNEHISHLGSSRNKDEFDTLYHMNILPGAEPDS